MRVIPDWRNKNLRCHLCGETRSVKYAVEVFDPVIDNKPTEVCVCNKCALVHFAHDVSNEKAAILEEYQDYFTYCEECKKFVKEKQAALLSCND